MRPRKFMKMSVFACLILVFLASSAIQAGTIYKSKGKDGQTVYSDQEPRKTIQAKTIFFEEAPSTPLSGAAQRYREELLKSAQQRSKAEPNDNAQPVLFWAKWCGYCQKAKAYLSEKGIAYQVFDIDTEVGMQNLVAVSGGSKGVPVLLWKGQQITGFSPAKYNAFFASKAK